MKLWLLKGSPDAAGWPVLQADSMAKKVNVISFDQDRWALLKVDQPPEQYEGLTATEPPDGLYLDNFGRPIYVLQSKEVHSARVVVAGLGQEAAELLDKLGDPDMVLDRLGRAY